MRSSKRRQDIINLISNHKVGTQEHLAELLEKKGYSTTQSSISRDLRQIGVVKIRGFYALPQKPEAAAVFGLIALETSGGNLIVARCEPGLASAVAVRIDNARITEIIGTIAGDDTIFIAVNDAKSQRAALKKIWELFEK